MILFWLVCACSATLAPCGGSLQRAGWLDRLVHYYKDALLRDVHRLAPIQIQASMERAPPGYTDSPEWDYGSVSRLLALLGASEAAAPVRRALRRALRPSQPTRRFISKQQSWNLFPSLGKNHPNEIYYDFNYYDYDETTVNPALLTELEDEDDAVVVLKNPVEARLPSARISVRLLREILEARAIAARKMPSTTRYSIAWIPMNKTGDNASSAEGNGTTVAASVGNDEATEGDGGGDAAGNDGAGGDADGGDGAAAEGDGGGDAGGDAGADAGGEPNAPEEIEKLHGPPANNKPKQVKPKEDVNLSPGLRKGHGTLPKKGAKNIKNKSKSKDKPKNKVKSSSVTRKMHTKPKVVSEKGVKPNVITKQ